MPGHFDASSYETVKERKDRFYADFPEGAVHVEIVSPPATAKEWVAVKAQVWRNREDMHKGYGPDSEGISLSLAGGQGADRDAWMENCEESAVGRALDNLGYHGNRKCSREEMEKAQRHGQLQAAPTPSDTAQNPPSLPQEGRKQNADSLITEPQRKRLYAISKQHGWADDQVKGLLAEYGYASSKEVKAGFYDYICLRLEAGPVVPAAGESEAGEGVEAQWEA